MKKLLVFLLGVLSVAGLKATDTVYIKAPQVPVLIERHDNVLFYMRLDARIQKYWIMYRLRLERMFRYHKLNQSSYIMEERKPLKIEGKNALLQ